MNILSLIKERRTIRRYKNKSISKQKMNTIIEAGIWASSIHGIQPWKFVVTANKLYIRKTSEILLKKSKKIGTGANVFLHSSANTIANAAALVAIYCTGEFAAFAGKLNKLYVKNAEIAEICAISAAIQNMILTATTLEIGVCWYSTPLFCEDEINKLLNSKDRLIAILTFGYSDESPKRSKRKSSVDAVRYI